MMSFITLHNHCNNYRVIKCNEQKKFHKAMNVHDFCAVTGLQNTLYQSHNAVNPTHNRSCFDTSGNVPVNDPF